jgi:hypothetical protein
MRQTIKAQSGSAGYIIIHMRYYYNTIKLNGVKIIKTYITQFEFIHRMTPKCANIYEMKELEK